MKENAEYNRVDEQRPNLIIWRIIILLSPWQIWSKNKRASTNNQYPVSVMTKGTSRQDCIEIQNTIEYIIEQLHVSKSEIRIETDKSLEKHSPLKLTEEEKESYHCLTPIRDWIHNGNLPTEKTQSTQGASLTSSTQYLRGDASLHKHL